MVLRTVSARIFISLAVLATTESRAQHVVRIIPEDMFFDILQLCVPFSSQFPIKTWNFLDFWTNTW